MSEQPLELKSRYLWRIVDISGHVAMKAMVNDLRMCEAVIAALTAQLAAERAASHFADANLTGDLEIALGEIKSLKAELEAAREWQYQPIVGNILLSLAGARIVIVKAQSIDGLPLTDDHAVCRRTGTAKEAE